MTRHAIIWAFSIWFTIGLGSLLTSEKKDDIREATHVWYGERAWMSKTLVNRWDDAPFQFYLTHHRDYSEDYQPTIMLAPWWETNDIAGMEKALDSMELLAADDFYYISRVSDTYEVHINAFAQLLSSHGFELREMYRGASVLIHAIREK